MSEPDNTAQGFGEWAYVELFGHKQLAGYVTEQQIAGAGFIRIEVPAIEGGVPRPGMTRIFGPKAVYGITPCTEAKARQLAAKLDPEPPQFWDCYARPALPAYDRDHEQIPGERDDDGVPF